MEKQEGAVLRKVEIAWLAAFYGPLLTPHQREVLRLSCEEDCSLGEIAGELGVTRQGIHDILSRAVKQLNHLEAQLGMYQRFCRTQEGLAQALSILGTVLPEKESENSLLAAREIIASLLEQNEEEENGL